MSIPSESERMKTLHEINDDLTIIVSLLELFETTYAVRDVMHAASRIAWRVLKQIKEEQGIAKGAGA